VPISTAFAPPSPVSPTSTADSSSVDGHWNVQEIFSAGDRVVARWTGTGTHQGELMGLEATGAPIEVDAISVFRIADGKIAEEWTVWDALGLLQRVGAVPVPA
jgi:predicted ester cyclase